MQTNNMTINNAKAPQLELIDDADLNADKQIPTNLSMPPKQDLLSFDTTTASSKIMSEGQQQYSIGGTIG